MYISSRKEILQGFAEEVKGYTPSLKQELDACMAAPDSGAFERLFRLVHTIRGAASMVGVSGLSQMASQMEKALLAVSSGELALDAKGYQVMDLTIGRFDAYADGLLQGVVDEVGLVTETVLAFRRLRGLPREEDQDALASLPDFIFTAKEDAAPPGATIHDDRIHFPEEDPAPAADPDPGLDLDILLEPKESGVESGRKSGKESGRESVKEPAGEADLDLDLDILLKPFEGEEASASSFPYPDLLEDFHQEAEDHLEEIGRALNRLQAEILEPVPVSPRLRDVVHDIQRAVHTLKGAASVVKFTEIAALAHGMEDLLDWLHDTVDLLTPEIVSLLTESADLLARITAEPDESRTDLIDALTDRYEILIKERAGGDPTAAASPADEVGIDADAFFEIEMEESDEEASDVAPAPDAALLDEPNADSGIGGEGVAGEDVAGEDVPRAPVESAAEVLPTKTIRVGMDRVDDLVNLAGELIIGLSAFDQQLDSFRESLDELELSRNRLRESARNLESGYEVKAIRRLGSENAPAGRGRRPVESEESEESEEFDSLELDRYSEFNLLIRGLNESVVDVGAINAQLDIFYSHFDGYITRQRVLINELQEKMMRMRMSPMAILSNRMYRTVREVAARLDKKVRLIVRGEDIELDREIWEKLTGPLMHLLRNAVDHGIELQSLRQALEKPEIGTVSVSASREGNRVIIRVEDDGGGLNYRAIKKAASQSGLANPSDKLSMEALAAMIFSPGFTTRGDVSEISGRGVGLDVVQENIRKLKGTVAVSSVSSGKGTRFTITIPLTLAVVRGLLFTANEKRFAAALSEISEILRVDPSNLISDPEPGVKLGDELLPLFRLSDLLRLPPAEDGAAVDPSSPLILVIEHRGRRKALAIDALLGQREIVIKSLGSHLRHVKGISGVTIMGDGSLIPILNLDEVFIDAAGRPESGEAIPEAPVPEKPPEIMVVDDSVSIRHVVSRLLMDQGWRVNTAKDGQEALEKMGEKRPDLIVLDIEMPRMNGFEFLSARKNQEAYQEIPVIILTSRTGAKHRQKAKRLGSDGYIIKPYDDAHFVNLIQTLLERRI